jgi:hypothetical protein
MKLVDKVRNWGEQFPCDEGLVCKCGFVAKTKMCWNQKQLEKEAAKVDAKMADHRKTCKQKYDWQK